MLSTVDSIVLVCVSYFVLIEMIFEFLSDFK